MRVPDTPPSAAPGAEEHEMVFLTVSGRRLSGSGGEAATADDRVPRGKQRGGEGGETASRRRDKGRRGAGVKGRLEASRRGPMVSENFLSVVLILGLSAIKELVDPLAYELFLGRQFEGASG